ncbi:MAG: hypothetical protein KGO96_05700 [Elusimicrobia bacterium]|nr:hypothetical protein [Elusimicrobiota bacterium]MDE2425383.1 hypothetical protein [Elusimicrobiota bacterium]
MTDTGKHIVAGVSQFRKLYSEIGRLLEQADNFMGPQGWKPRTNTCYSSSASVEKPEKWLPVVLCRLYYNPQQKGLFSFVSVILDDPDQEAQVLEPLVSAGWCDYGKKNATDHGFVSGWASCHVILPAPTYDGAMIVTDDKEWLEPEKYDIIRYGSLALPLTSMTSIETLKTKVIDPLLAELCRPPSKAR